MRLREIPDLKASARYRYTTVGPQASLNTKQERKTQVNIVTLLSLLRQFAIKWTHAFLHNISFVEYLNLKNIPHISSYKNFDLAIVDLVL